MTTFLSHFTTAKNATCAVDRVILRATEKYGFWPSMDDDRRIWEQNLSFLSRSLCRRRQNNFDRVVPLKVYKFSLIFSYDSWNSPKSSHWNRNAKLCYLRLSFELYRQKTYLRTCAPSEASDQTAHSRSLIRIFTVCTLESQGCKVSSCGQRRLRSNCANVLGAHILWAHMSKCTFFSSCGSFNPCCAE